MEDHKNVTESCSVRQTLSRFCLLAHQLELKADANEEEGFAEAALAFAAASAAVFRLVDEITAEL